MDNNSDFKESSEPLGIIREEVVEVTENPNDETLSSMEDQNEDQKNKIKTDNRHM